MDNIQYIRMVGNLIHAAKMLREGFDSRVLNPIQQRFHDLSSRRDEERPIIEIIDPYRDFFSQAQGVVSFNGNLKGF